MKPTLHQEELIKVGNTLGNAGQTIEHITELVGLGNTLQS